MAKTPLDNLGEEHMSPDSHTHLCIHQPQCSQAQKSDSMYFILKYLEKEGKEKLKGQINSWNWEIWPMKELGIGPLYTRHLAGPFPMSLKCILLNPSDKPME